MTGSRDMDQKHQEYPKIGVFPIYDPKDFFSEIGLCHFFTIMMTKCHAKYQKKLMDGL